MLTALGGSCSASYRDRVGPLEISVEDGPGGTIVRLSGEADVTAARQLRDVLDIQMKAGARRLTVDMAGLRFADSATIQILLAASRTLAGSGGRLELARPGPVVTQALRLLGVDQMLRIHPGDPGQARQ